MKVAITGGRGMLGRTLERRFAKEKFQVIITDLPEVDITQEAAVEEFMERTRPDVVIHCAAMTAVDLCEQKVEQAYRINALGSLNVASACHRNSVRLIAISTDYVFDGSASHPYSEFDVATGGATCYGKSKFAGEEMIRRHCPNHFIARVSWLYGPGGPSFVHAMLKLASEGRPVLKVVDDQYGNPTSTLAVAEMLVRVLKRPYLCGTYHMTCEGEATWYTFAETIFELTGVRQAVQPCTTAEFPRPAPRPANSRLDKMMLRLAGFPAMPSWQNALREFLRAEGLLREASND